MPQARANAQAVFRSVPRQLRPGATRVRSSRARRSRRHHRPDRAGRGAPAGAQILASRRHAIGTSTRRTMPDRKCARRTPAATLVAKPADRAARDSTATSGWRGGAPPP